MLKLMTALLAVTLVCAMSRVAQADADGPRPAARAPFTMSPEAVDARIAEITKDIDVVPRFCRATDANGTSDNTACIQRAVDFACENGIGTLRFASYKFYIASQILIRCDGQYWRGSGSGNRDTPNHGTLFISGRACTGSLIKWQSARENYSYGGGISDVGFYNNYDATSCDNYLIEAQFVKDFYLDRIYAWNPYKFAQAGHGIHFAASRISIDGLRGGGIAFDLSGRQDAFDVGARFRQDIPTFDDIFITNGPVDARGKHGTCFNAHGFTATLNIRNARCVNPERGLSITCDGGGPNGMGGCAQFVSLWDFEADFCYEYCLYAEDVQVLAAHFIYLHGKDDAKNTLKVVNNVYNTSSSLEINGGTIDAAQGSCIYAQVAKTVLTGGIVVFNCNRANTGAAGVEIVGSRNGKADTVGRATISDLQFCKDHNGEVASAMPAVILRPRTGFNFVHDNHTDGCTSSGSVPGNPGIYDDSGRGPTNKIHDNG